MKKYSVAIFGSSLRSNFDKYSDKDLIVIAQSYKELSRLQKKYESQGFSVSLYTYKKLQYLSDIGNLFVQHLKKESSILIDYDNILQKLLSEHKETSPTSEQVLESIIFFNLVKYVPDTPLGYAWFCDCFYVGIRNYLILQSAIKLDFNFSFLDLINELLKNNIINKSDYEILRQLRVLKKNYRDRINEEYPSKKFIVSLEEIGYKLNLLDSVNFVDRKGFIDFFKNKISKDDINHYFKLRLLEIYYLLLGKRIREIDKIICNPQFYALKFKDMGFIETLIKSIDKKNDPQHGFWYWAKLSNKSNSSVYNKDLWSPENEVHLIPNVIPSP